MEISGKNVNSLKPLVEIFEKQGNKEYLLIIKRLSEINLIGLSIYWAYQFSDHNMLIFKQKIMDGDQKMIDFINQQADYHQCFAGNQKNIPRPILFPSSYNNKNNYSVLSSPPKNDKLEAINSFKLKSFHLFFFSFWRNIAKLYFLIEKQALSIN
eukprot:TRINITY_DN9162_c0_g1_i1.p1 TRINITY_DN9162_c0_g1~~TRINITY_DN9162_c0_g1_i1.p1  ORF type:complete len:155 (-),score=38.33 TRINITY_DN9162_c0_g1_i1:58-522(-)